MVAQGYIGRNPGDSSVVISRQSFTASGITTDFTFASGYTVGYFDLYINGVRLIEGTDYTASDSATFTVLNGGAQNGDVLEGVAYKAFNLGDTYTSRVGIQSAGIVIGNAETLNFVGTGNTFAVNGTTIDVSISGGAGAGGTWTTYDSSTGITTTKKVKIDNNLEVTGFVTATSGLRIPGGTFLNTRLELGNSQEFSFQYNTASTKGIVRVSSSDLDIEAKNIGLYPNNGENGVLAKQNGAVELYYDNVKKFETSGIGVTITGESDVNGDLNVSGVSTFAGASNFNSTINVADDIEANFGASSDGRIFFENSANEFHVRVPGGSGKLTLGAGAPVQITNEDGNTNRAVFTSNGATITGVVTATGSVQVGSGQSFGSSGASAAVYYGDGSNLTGIAVGLATEALVANNSVVTLDLTKQDHKITATGICTITVTGGTEADSHTVRLINSGIATVGFSTYFLFPSGATPSLPEADGSISLLSFTVNRVGAGGTQLLTGASLNYS